MRLFRTLIILFSCLYFTGCEVKARLDETCRMKISNKEERDYICNEQSIKRANASQILYMYDMKNPNFEITYQQEACISNEPCIPYIKNMVPEKYKEASKHISKERLGQMITELIAINSDNWQKHRQDLLNKQNKTEQELERLKNL